MKKVVSIIIPVYNVEEFIFKTVKSVMNQDYKDIEIILVDDGSPDNSAKIIDELAKRDDRIVCVHKDNGGVSSARNVGLRMASGEYVTFIDGDDWVEPNYISYLLNLVESNNCQIGMNKNNYSDYNIQHLLWGKVGTGKSYFAGCIANALMEQEVAVRMTNFSAILNDLTASFEGRNEYIERLCRFSLLIKNVKNFFTSRLISRS